MMSHLWWVDHSAAPSVSPRAQSLAIVSVPQTDLSLAPHLGSHCTKINISWILLLDWQTITEVFEQTKGKLNSVGCSLGLLEFRRSERRFFSWLLWWILCGFFWWIKLLVLWVWFWPFCRGWGGDVNSTIPTLPPHSKKSVSGSQKDAKIIWWSVGVSVGCSLGAKLGEIVGCSLGSICCRIHLVHSDDSTAPPTDSK